MRSRKGVFSFLKKHHFSFFTNAYKEKKKIRKIFLFETTTNFFPPNFSSIYHSDREIIKRTWKEKRENLQFNRKNSKQVSGVNTKHFCS